jgi:hypothetical protein
MQINLLIVMKIVCNYNIDNINFCTSVYLNKSNKLILLLLYSIHFENYTFSQ